SQRPSFTANGTSPLLVSAWRAYFAVTSTQETARNVHFFGIARNVLRQMSAFNTFICVAKSRADLRVILRNWRADVPVAKGLSGRQIPRRLLKLLSES